MARIAKRRQNYQAGKAGATQASQEKQDDGVSQGTPPGGNHEYADVNLDIHARDAHDNIDNTDCDENNNSDFAATTNGDDRPDVHGHEGGQAGDLLQLIWKLRRIDLTCLIIGLTYFFPKGVDYMAP